MAPTCFSLICILGESEPIELREELEDIDMQATHLEQELAGVSDKIIPLNNQSPPRPPHLRKK